MPDPAVDVFVGESPRAKQTMRLVQKIGQCRWPVLLLGETGTGKEVIARTIHSVNPVGPFVTVDCSAMVGPLMESELFGHARGSFTGAVNAKLGLIETANGGTVFLDEIGELPLDLQSKLLRVLQQKEFRPVGSNTSRKVEFRVIAATNRDLTHDVDTGAFRRDLFYRINVVTLRLAPLRDRKEDIPPMISHFLAKYGSDHELSADALEVMIEYAWPGNVRELENCIQRMVAIATGKTLTVADLPSPLKAFATQLNISTEPVREPVEPPPSPSLTMLPPSRPQPVRAILPLEEVERRAILDALEFTRGDRGLASTLLGIGRTTLYRKLREYQTGKDERFRKFFRDDMEEMEDRVTHRA